MRLWAAFFIIVSLFVSQAAAAVDVCGEQKLFWVLRPPTGDYVLVELSLSGLIKADASVGSDSRKSCGEELDLVLETARSKFMRLSCWRQTAPPSQNSKLVQLKIEMSLDTDTKLVSAVVQNDPGAEGFLKVQRAGETLEEFIRNLAIKKTAEMEDAYLGPVPFAPK